MIKKANGKNIHAKMRKEKKEKKIEIERSWKLKRNEKIISAELPCGYAKTRHILIIY